MLSVYSMYMTEKPVAFEMGSARLGSSGVGGPGWELEVARRGVREVRGVPDVELEAVGGDAHVPASRHHLPNDLARDLARYRHAGEEL